MRYFFHVRQATCAILVAFLCAFFVTVRPVHAATIPTTHPSRLPATSAKSADDMYTWDVYAIVYKNIVFDGYLTLQKQNNGNYKGTFHQYAGNKTFPATGIVNPDDTGTLTINASNGKFVFKTDTLFSMGSSIALPTKYGTAAIAYLYAYTHSALTTQTFKVALYQVYGPLLNSGLVQSTGVQGTLRLTTNGSYKIVNGDLSLPGKKGKPTSTPVVSSGYFYPGNTMFVTVKVFGKTFSLYNTQATTSPTFDILSGTGSPSNPTVLEFFIEQQ